VSDVTCGQCERIVKGGKKAWWCRGWVKCENEIVKGACGWCNGVVVRNVSGRWRGKDGSVVVSVRRRVMFGE
jgi:hypothetical protein